MLKKIGQLLTLSFLLILCFNSVGYAATDTESIKVIMDGEQLQFEEQPFIENDVTLVPFRPIFEKFGLKVEWDENTKTVTGRRSDLIIKLVINNTSTQVNDEKRELVVAPRIVNGNTMVPLRFVSESSGKKVYWNDNTRTINITEEKESITDDKNGTLTYSNGSTYTGEVKNGKPHGKGIKTIFEYDDFGVLGVKKLIRKYDGQWNNGEWNGGKVSTYDLQGNAFVAPTSSLVNSTPATNKNTINGNNNVVVNNNITNNNTTINNGNSNTNTPTDNNSPDISSIHTPEKFKEIHNFLSSNYSKLDTVIGSTYFKFDIFDNTNTFTPYDYWIMVNYDDKYFYGAMSSISYTTEQKNTLRRQLKDHQENLAKALIQRFPNIKFEGGYYSSYYKYPTLRVDLQVTRYFSWMNYDHVFGVDAYNKSKPSTFRWYENLDDKL